MSQSQPIHRRPSWARTQKAYECHMNPGRSMDRSKDVEFADESFSYDETHLSKWAMPEELADRLPAKLRDAAVEWKYAGAAVITALDRIRRLDDQSVYRGYPEKSTTSHLARRISVQSPTRPGAESPRSPISPAPLLPSAAIPLEQLKSLEGLPRRQIIGMESPPFTPVDTFTSPTPTVGAQVAPATIPDAHALADRLSPLSIGRRDSATSTPASQFDENAWETFLSSFRAELHDVRKEAWVRLRGRGHEINRLRVECAVEATTAAQKQSVQDFNAWWQGMKPQLSAYEERIRQLDLPNIEHVKLERQAIGLPI